MASRVGQPNRILAHPRFATLFSFRRSGSECVGLGGHMAERQVGSSDTLDVPDVWRYGGDTSQRSIPAPGPIDFNAQLYAGDCNSRNPELTSIVFPGGISPL